MPFNDWPYGGTTPIGTTRTASVDSPLMVALAPTAFGRALASTGIQIYGWINFGGNLSTSRTPGGNAPAGYDFTPNVVQLDQAVVYIERLPDTVQTDHIDYGFRLSFMYGENYRYTTAYGIASYQLLKKNDFYGYDFPMVYAEVYIPGALQGLMLRIGRFISVPDIEAQLAPNNYMYTHSISYTFDNFTNEGLQTTLAITRQFMLQLGVTTGTEAAVWQVGAEAAKPVPEHPRRPGHRQCVPDGQQPADGDQCESALPRFDLSEGPRRDPVSDGLRPLPDPEPPYRHLPLRRRDQSWPVRIQ